MCLNYVCMETHRVCYAHRKNKHTNKQNLAERRQAREKSFFFFCVRDWVCVRDRVCKKKEIKKKV